MSVGKLSFGRAAVVANLAVCVSVAAVGLAASGCSGAASKPRLPSALVAPKLKQDHHAWLDALASDGPENSQEQDRAQIRRIRGISAILSEPAPDQKIQINTYRGQIPAAPRSEVSKSVAINYESIPLMEEKTPTSSSLGAEFKLVRQDQTPKCPAGMEPRRKVTWQLKSSWTSPMVAKIDSFVLPSLKLGNGQYEDPQQTLETLREYVGDAEWGGFTTSTATKDAIDYSRFSGSFDRLSAKAKTMGSVHAPALVSDTLYAFRRCVSGCNAPLTSDQRVEEVTLIGPPALWLGSSGALAEQKLQPDQAFTIVKSLVRPGGSASLQLMTWDDGVRQFHGGAPSANPGQQLVGKKVQDYTLDIVWQSSSTPDVTLYINESDATAEQLAPYSPYNYYGGGYGGYGEYQQPDCYPSYNERGYDLY
ncbi:MAG: hypothetical protein U0414_04440 [Polyangiaceae bacterium]